MLEKKFQNHLHILQNLILTCPPGQAQDDQVNGLQLTHILQSGGVSRGGQQEELGDEEQFVFLKKEALRFIKGGQWGKAKDCVTSHDVSDIGKPANLQQIRDKFPPK